MGAELNGALRSLLRANLLLIRLNHIDDYTYPNFEFNSYQFRHPAGQPHTWSGYIGDYFKRVVASIVDMITRIMVTPPTAITSGGTRIAMRLYQGGSTTEYWLLSDHRGLLTQPCSQSITANEDGSLNSEVRYSAFGETRYTSATGTPTDYLYTGQRIEEEAGLYYYGARFYDTALAHFVQADTVVQTISNFLSWVRYAYVKFNPLIYIDPSGHAPANGCSSELDTGNCPVDWDNGGLDDGGSGGDDGNGDSTHVDRSKLTSGGKKAYEIYLQMFYNKNGWWWRRFGGDFTLQNFITIGVFYAEGGAVLADDANAFLSMKSGLNLIDAMSEGGSRAYYNYIIYNGLSDSKESLLNWAYENNQSFSGRINGVFSGNNGGTMPEQFAYQFDIKNAMSVANKFFTPDPSWKEGMRSFRPFHWGNDDKDLTYLSQYADDVSMTVWYYRNFYIPTGQGSNK